jgi:hypothetical protein
MKLEKSTRRSAHEKATSSMGRASILLAVSRILRDTSSSRSRGHLARIFFHNEFFTAMPPFLRKETEDAEAAFSITTQ